MVDRDKPVHVSREVQTQNHRTLGEFRNKYTESRSVNAWATLMGYCETGNRDSWTNGKVAPTRMAFVGSNPTESHKTHEGCLKQ